MPGTRTAPALTTAASSISMTLHVIDASGDLYAENLVVDSAATAIQKEAIVAAYQAATNSSVWKVTESSIWQADADPDNAVAEYRASVKDGVNLLFKDASFNGEGFRLVAPIAATMQGNQDIPLLSATEFSNLIVAVLAVRSGYSLESAQYTERKERSNNPRIRA